MFNICKFLDTTTLKRKTTPVQWVCHDWSVYCFAQDYELVIKVALRSLPEDQKLSLKELTYTSVGDESVVEEVVQYISSNQGADFLSVLDGYGEVSVERRQKLIVSEIMASRVAP